MILQKSLFAAQKDRAKVKVCLNPKKVDVWNPCQVWRVVAATTTLKKCYKLCLFDQIVSQIKAYIK